MRFLPGVLNILGQKERKRLLLFIFLDVIISALDIAFLALMIIVINFYIHNNSLPYSSFLPRSLADQNSILLLLVFFILFGMKNLIGYLISRSKYQFIYNAASRLSDQNIRRYLKEDYLKFVNVDSSAYIYKIRQQPIEFSTYILTNLQQVVSQSVLVFFTIMATLIYNAALFLLLMLFLLPVVLILGWLIKKQLKSVRQNIKRTSEDSLKTLKEALAGYVESNVYNKEDFFAERYSVQQEQLNRNLYLQQSLQALPSRLIEIFVIFGFFLLIVINKWSAQSASVDLLTIGVFVAAAYKIIPGAVKILNSTGQMKTYEFILDDLKPTVDKTPNEAMQSGITSVILDKIHFRYNGQPVLNNTTLNIKPGDFIGLSGSSGRGKTTLINILLGFLDQQEGVVSINNKIVNDNDRKQYWNRISYIRQQPFFIYDTLMKNITLQDGDIDNARLNEVISFCGLDTFLVQHPEYDNLVITENGKSLSGGQRQRVMLARALYHGFDLLILDEPFGELDQESENSILEKLQMLAAEGKMILFVTHNGQSLSYCNKLVSLHEQG